MNLIKYLVAIIVCSVLFSCETAIDLNLKTAEPRLVIDASLGARNPCMVQLSMTKGYWEQDIVPTGVKGAIITLKDNKGNSERLIETTSNGNYASHMLGVVGNTYTLTVEVGEKTYIATEILPDMVPIESIRTYKVDSGGDTYFYPCISYMDPIETENYYLYLLTINNKRLQKVRFEDDKNSNGKRREPILFFDDKENNDNELKVGDYVHVEMQSVSIGAYNFYKTISSPGGSQNSNPVSNFSGGVLGMFKTYSSSTIEMTITEEDLQ